MNNSDHAHPLKQRLGGRNLYLIGMMGCGKSLTGPSLAKKLSYGFVDTDAVIEQACQRSIMQIFEEESENSFRDIETKVLKEIGRRHSLVVATGGGVVTRSENWGVLHQGIVIWIDPGRNQLIERLHSDQNKRPLLMNSDPLASFDALLIAREPLYMEADLRVLVNEETPEEVAMKILVGLPAIIHDPKGSTSQQTIER